MTFEEIEAHIKRSNLDQFQKPQATHGAAAALTDTPAVTPTDTPPTDTPPTDTPPAEKPSLEDSIAKVSAIYQVVRPILVVLTAFPLIPASFKKAIKTFIDVLDVFSPPMPETV
jgi:hypothetical protein